MTGSPSSRSSEPAAILRPLKKLGGRPIKELVGIVAAVLSIALIVALFISNEKLWFAIVNLNSVSLMLDISVFFASVVGLLAVISLVLSLLQIRRPETGNENSLSNTPSLLVSSVDYPIIPQREYPLVALAQKPADPLSRQTTQHTTRAPGLSALSPVAGTASMYFQTPTAASAPRQLSTPFTVQQTKRPYALADIQYFILPKEGETPEKCQDRFALNRELRRFAVADGVSQSFVPGEWAKIIADDYVDHPRKFLNALDFASWLLSCSSKWYEWTKKEWMEKAIRKRQEERNGLYDEKEEARRDRIWQEDVETLRRSGAQATFIGCAVEPHLSAQDGLVDVHVLSVGDANFFLFRRMNDRNWSYEAFPNTSPDEFTSKPFTLTTSPDQMIQAWDWKKTRPFLNVHPGDYIVLASDALAKWLLIQVREKGVNTLLSSIMLNTDRDFKALVDKERKQRRLEDDDVTMLVIPIQAALQPFQGVK